jgi:hypothetical protein
MLLVKILLKLALSLRLIRCAMGLLNIPILTQGFALATDVAHVSSKDGGREVPDQLTNRE